VLDSRDGSLLAIARTLLLDLRILILVLEGGWIVERGTHAGLVAREGFFQRPGAYDQPYNPVDLPLQIGQEISLFSLCHQISLKVLHADVPKL